ncbi:hypothetical protein A3K82_00870 [Candidatus Pacearchaeota archaeon RBG_19FT_COMBO_34_9]|nr:MAG: hypothetical protein A3K82_00870 [Candidatus Pacearchaeota archaeon RBG_19FT_COMBO_34_9]OGJ16552.1 MAG: hypothetical protein A3K74_00405 [Candidatus Pacearchaeota archaeon RBG_13_33_26]
MLVNKVQTFPEKNAFGCNATQERIFSAPKIFIKNNPKTKKIRLIIMNHKVILNFLEEIPKKFLFFLL